MWYGGDNGANEWKIGYATSSDGLSWTKYANNPVLPTGAGWDSRCVFNPTVMYDGTAYKLWYTGISAGWSQKIGYAEGWNTVPNAPSLTAPANNVWTSSSLPTFTWTFSDTNTQDMQTAYEVQISTVSDFSSVFADSGKVSSATSSFTPSSPLVDGTYYWRAMVWDSDDDNGTWSGSRTIRVDTVAPSNPSGFSSASHTISTWSNDSTIEIQFSGASDATSGIKGYSVLWDYSASTIPDAAQDIDYSVSNRTSPAMSDNNSIYFHIRAIDNASNIAADAAHYGPFYIDTTPPTNPTLASSTHTVGVWSNQTICNVSLSGANGSISGVNGYSVIWDNSAGTLPDTVKEHNASSSDMSSPALADGTWYFHLRTRDEAGNWAIGAAHFGPVQVDATPPFNPLKLTSDHLLSNWSNDSTVNVSWEDFNGSLSGVDGFSYVWDTTLDTIPDDSNECNVSVTSSTSTALADGSSHYFHIRTSDKAGNWNQSAAHIGPFWLDSTPPANPIAVTSGSHVVSRWSNDTTIDISWSTADGGGRLSGYDGFSIAWDVSPSTIPDMTADLGAEATNTTSPPMGDGDSIYFHIRALDRAGNWAVDAVHQGPFWIDSTPPKNPPTLTSSSHRTEEWSNDSTVQMNWTAADAAISGVDGYSFTWDTSAFTLPVEAVNVTGETLGTTSPPLADGNSWYFHLRTKDRAGNWAVNAMHQGPFYIDTTPPVVLSFRINDGAPYSVNTTVSLSVSAEDPQPGSGLLARRCRVDSGDWGPWEEYSEKWSLILGGSDGIRTISLQVQDRLRNTCTEVNASILLDTRAPSGIVLRINDGADCTNSTNAILTMEANETEPGSGVSEMALSRDGNAWDSWEPFCISRPYVLTAGDGPKSIYLKVRDRAGNVGSVANATILLDTIAPVQLSITIADGAAFTTSPTVPLKLQASDPQPASRLGEMAFSVDGSAWSAWEPFAAQRNYTFTAGDGLRLLFFKVRDRAQNEAAPVNDSILLDSTAPVMGLVQVSGITQSMAVVIWTTDEPSNGLVEYGPSTAYGSSLTDPAFYVEHGVTLAGLAAGTEYHVRVSAKDALGNGPAISSDVTFRTLKREDKKAPEIAGLHVEALTDRSAVVSWATDEPANGMVEYGTTKDLGLQSGTLAFAQSHLVPLTGLTPNTLYYFRVKSTDPSGNAATSTVQTFSTLGTADRTPPHISNVQVTGITDSLAVVSWSTDELANSRVELGPAGQYNRNVTADRYDLEHNVVLSGLLSGKEYHFRVGSTDVSGNGPSYSADMSFTTSLVKDTSPPVIQGTRVLSVGLDNVTLEVTLSEPGAVLVDYGTSQSYGKSLGSSRFQSIHTITLTGLEPGSTYHYRVSSTDASGNGPATGPDATFRTKSAPVTGGGLLSVESAPYLLVIVVIAVAAATGLYVMSRRRMAQRPPPPPSAPAPGIEVVEKVSADELEDEP